MAVAVVVVAATVVVVVVAAVSFLLLLLSAWHSCPPVESSPLSNPRALAVASP